NIESRLTASVSLFDLYAIECRIDVNAITNNFSQIQPLRTWAHSNLADLRLLFRVLKFCSKLIHFHQPTLRTQAHSLSSANITDKHTPTHTHTQHTSDTHTPTHTHTHTHKHTHTQPAYSRTVTHTHTVICRATHVGL